MGSEDWWRWGGFSRGDVTKMRMEAAAFTHTSCSQPEVRDEESRLVVKIYPKMDGLMGTMTHNAYRDETSSSSGLVHMESAACVDAIQE